MNISVPIICSLTNTTHTLNLNPYYITGFVDGEGSFIATVNPNSKYTTGYRVKSTFSIGLHKRDLPLLGLIKNYFGVGNITKQGENSFIYRVTCLKELEIIISHFDSYPLLTKKHADFLLFKEIINLMKEKEHINMEGLKKILSIKASLNLGLSTELNEAFPDIVPVLRPSLNSNLKNQDLNWLSGFTDAEGCFFVSIKESLKSKLKEAVSLRFIITQHLRDEELIRSFITILGCGRYISRSNQECGEFVVEKLSDINKKIIPLFEVHKLYGNKRYDFEEFKIVANLMKNKNHLTLNGLNEIKKIKSNMNTLRK